VTVRSDKVAPESELAEALVVHLLRPQRHGPELGLAGRPMPPHGTVKLLALGRAN